VSKWEFFSNAELKCKCGKCGSTGNEMDDQFMLKLTALRRLLGFPFIISSAYRCPAHNNAVSKTGSDGPHTTGKAVDIVVRGERAYELLHAAINAGFTGIGINQKGANRFIHLDTLTKEENYPRPALWSY
jgi:zinc D-Ala-D-Ala carboxypeptidase